MRGTEEVQETDEQVSVAAVHAAAVGLGAMVKDILAEDTHMVDAAVEMGAVLVGVEF